VYIKTVMFMRKILTISFLVVMLGLMLAPALHAQGCAMCYTTAAGQDPAAARKLDMAILALLIPVLVLFTCVLGLLIHRRNSEEPGCELDDSSALPVDLPSPRNRSVVHLHLELPPSAGD
jgi:ABC-type sulfate transport system permease subunit